jgi:hypothetical protein
MTKFTRYVLDNGSMIIVKTSADLQRIRPNSKHHRLKDYEIAAMEAANDATNEVLAKTAHTFVVDGMQHAVWYVCFQFL